MSSAPGCGGRALGPAGEQKDILGGFFFDVDFLNFQGVLLGAAPGAETSALAGVGETFPPCCLRVPVVRGCSAPVPAWARSPRCRCRCRSVPGGVPRPVSPVLSRGRGSPKKAPCASWCPSTGGDRPVPVQGALGRGLGTRVPSGVRTLSSVGFSLQAPSPGVGDDGEVGGRGTPQARS